MADQTTNSAPLGAASIARAAVGFVVYWMPVWVPLVLLAQISLRGLRPALLERERLAHEEVTVKQRFQTTSEAFERMQDEATAWDDPVYRERLRRARAEQAGPPPLDRVAPLK